MKFGFLLPYSTAAWIVLAAFFFQNDLVLANNDNNNFLSTRVSMIELTKQLLAPLGVLLKAAVEEASDFLPNKQLSDSAQFGTCCDIGDFGAKLQMELFEFELEEVNEDEQIEMETSPNDSVVKVSSAASNLRITTGLATTIGLAALIPFSCEVSSKAEITIDRYAIDFDVDLQENKVADFHMATIDEGQATVKITPTLSGICEVVEEPILNVFEEISNSLTVMFRNVFSKKMTDLIIDQVNVAIQFLLPGDIIIDLSPENFLPGRSLTITPKLDSLSTGLISTDWKTSAQMKAFLSVPSWRDGSTFVYEDYDPNYNLLNMPEPELDHAFNLRIGAPALNKFFTTAWYLGWSKVADEEIDVTDPSLCDPDSALYTDPCPFPPSKKTVSFFNFEFYALFLMYPMKMFTAFDLQTLMSPPNLKFIEEGISGRGTVSLTIKGRRGAGSAQNLATIKTSYNAKGGLPGFNYDTGHISILKLNELFFDELDIEFNSAPILSSLTTVFANVGAMILRAASSLLLGFVNDTIEKAVNKLPTLLLPDMEAFPILSGIFKFYLPVGGLKAVAGSETTASYVEIWGDLGTRTLNTEENGDDGNNGNSKYYDENNYYYNYDYDYAKSNIFNEKTEGDHAVNPKNYCDTARQWAQESRNHLASFSCAYSGSLEKKHMTFKADIQE